MDGLDRSNSKTCCLPHKPVRVLPRVLPFHYETGFWLVGWLSCAYSLAFFLAHFISSRLNKFLVVVPLCSSSVRMYYENLPRGGGHHAQNNSTPCHAKFQLHQQGFQFPFILILPKPPAFLSLSNSHSPVTPLQ